MKALAKIIQNDAHGKLCHLCFPCSGEVTEWVDGHALTEESWVRVRWKRSSDGLTSPYCLPPLCDRIVNRAQAVIKLVIDDEKPREIRWIVSGLSPLLKEYHVKIRLSVQTLFDSPDVKGWIAITDWLFDDMLPIVVPTNTCLSEIPSPSVENSEMAQALPWRKGMVIPLEYDSDPAFLELGEEVDKGVFESRLTLVGGVEPRVGGQLLRSVSAKFRQRVETFAAVMGAILEIRSVENIGSSR